MVRFGPSGNQDIFYSEGNKNTLQAFKWLNEKGLTCYEYSFSRGINLKEDTALAFAEQTKKYDIALSIHAPFYINFANADESMIEKSTNYVLNCLKYCKLMNAKKLVVHIGSMMKLTREVAIENVKKNLQKTIMLAKEQNLLGDILICPETMGKHSQIGDYKEIIDICTLDECLVPAFDIGHINCFSLGTFNSYKNYCSMLDYAFLKLGDRVKNCHIHFAKMEYGTKGEIKHLNYDDEIFGPDFTPFAKAIKKYDISPTVICESTSHMATDSIILRDIYNSL